MRPFTDVRIAACYAMIRRPAKTTLDIGGEWSKDKGALSKLRSAMSTFGRGWTFWRRGRRFTLSRHLATSNSLRTVLYKSVARKESFLGGVN